MPTLRSLLLLALALPAAALGQVPGLDAQVPGRAPAPIGATPPTDPKAQEEPPTEAELLIDEAIAKVRALTAVEADLRQEVKMLGQEFRVLGQYVKGPGNQARLELNLKGLADVDGTFLQVCDGSTFWDYQKILNAQSYHRVVGVDRILKRLDGPEFDVTMREQIIARFGFSGPDALLVGLRKAILFDQKEEETYDGRKVWIVRGGQWKDRAALVPPGQAPPQGPLLPYIPSVAALTIGQEDGWPYRLELRGRPRSMVMDRRSAGSSRPALARQDQVSSIVLTYSNVRLGGPIDGSRFTFQAPDPRLVVDDTEEILTFLEKVAQASQQARKAESGQDFPGLAPGPGPGADGTLNRSIPLPSTGSGTASPVPPRDGTTRP